MFREALHLLIWEGALLLLFLAGWIGLRWFFFMPAGIAMMLIVLFTLFFFRSPVRVIPAAIPADSDYIVAPADGIIAELIPEMNCPYDDTLVSKLSIFMSLLDVHVNRNPVSGLVVSVKHFPGAFMPAFREKASIANEQTLIIIQHPRGTMYVKQIAGMLARRIVCRLSPGEYIEKGAIFGMIRFGSRMEMFVPLHVDWQIRKGDRVRAGETIVGNFQKR